MITPARIWLIESTEAEVAEVLRQGGSHPALGGLIDLGTSACLLPGTGDRPAAKVEELCAQLNGGISVVRRGLGTPGLRAELEIAALASPVFAIIFPDEGADESPLVVAAGPTLPSMGFIGDCDLATLEASVWFALGKADLAPSTLFTEPPSGADEHQDERLDERLRQLYGE